MKEPIMKSLVSFFLLLLLTGCAATKKINPNKKYGKDQLLSDYALFRRILEAQHPGLYWYTAKDSMDYYFEQGETMLKDSLTETGFRNILTYVVSKIKCGHTTVRSSKAFTRAGTGRFFPLVLKIWNDTAIVTSNLNRRDSNVIRGVQLTAIDNRPLHKIVDSMFQHLSADGYNLTHKYQTLSNRGVFGSWYTALFGIKSKYSVSYIDSIGNTRSAMVSLYNYKPDSARKMQRKLAPRQARRQRHKQLLAYNRNLRFDTSLSMAVMDLSTFTRGYRLQRFFRSSFRKLQRKETQNLVIDLRSNGGGSVTNSNLLTKYIIDKRFKIADSIYAIKRTSPFWKYQENRFSNWLFLTLMTHRKKDGYYHFRYFERKYFKPKKRNHFDGKVFVLTGGNTFSASTLFAQVVKGQHNVTIVGEETGGGAYGNNAWLIPDVTLPITKVRFRLPLFRLVIDKNIPKNGHGIIPEVEATPSVQAIRQNDDFKMDKVRELIKSNANQSAQTHPAP